MQEVTPNIRRNPPGIIGDFEEPPSGRMDSMERHPTVSTTVKLRKCTYKQRGQVDQVQLVV